MKALKPIQASAEFIRDNQYNEKYEVVLKEDNKILFEHLLDYHGEASLMQFPSGKKCFFCEVL